MSSIGRPIRGGQGNDNAGPAFPGDDRLTPPVELFHAPTLFMRGARDSPDGSALFMRGTRDSPDVGPGVADGVTDLLGGGPLGAAFKSSPASSSTAAPGFRPALGGGLHRDAGPSFSQFNNSDFPSLLPSNDAFRSFNSSADDPFRSPVRTETTPPRPGIGRGWNAGASSAFASDLGLSGLGGGSVSGVGGGAARTSIWKDNFAAIPSPTSSSDFPPMMPSMSLGSPRKLNSAPVATPSSNGAVRALNLDSPLGKAALGKSTPDPSASEFVPRQRVINSAGMESPVMASATMRMKNAQMHEMNQLHPHPPNLHQQQHHHHHHPPQFGFGGGPEIGKTDSQSESQFEMKENGTGVEKSNGNNRMMIESVGGTTYFYNPEHPPPNPGAPQFSLSAATTSSTTNASTGFSKPTSNHPQHGAAPGSALFPPYTLYPGPLPHLQNMKPKSSAPGFFMSEEIKAELLHRQALTLVQLDPSLNPEIPAQVDTYHNLFPLEPLSVPAIPQKHSAFPFRTTCFRATSVKDGLAYCLRRIHDFRLTNTKPMAIIDMWKKLQHSNLVSLRNVFTAKSGFKSGENSLVYVYDFYPGAETLLSRHFSAGAVANPLLQVPGFAGGVGTGKMLTGGGGSGGEVGDGDGHSGNNGEPRQHAGLLPESLIWTYVVQLSSAIRTVHAAGLACRVLGDPSKIIVTGKSRLRINGCGVLDVLLFDQQPGLGNGGVVTPQAVAFQQQEDLVAMGRLVLALACNSLLAIQARDHVAPAMEVVARNYSTDLKNLLLYLLGNTTRLRNVNDVMPMIGARFYTQLDAAQLRSDVIEGELMKEVENGRLFRLLGKLNVVLERAEFHLDPNWSEMGDRYILKLFRDYVFHQVSDDRGTPWLDFAHVVSSLNKFDAGIPEKICLMSRDEQNVIIVTYTDLKRSFDTAFGELLQSSLALPHSVSAGSHHAANHAGQHLANHLANPRQNNFVSRPAGSLGSAATITPTMTSPAVSTPTMTSTMTAESELEGDGRGRGARVMEEGSVEVGGEAEEGLADESERVEVAEEPTAEAADTTSESRQIEKNDSEVVESEAFADSR